MRKPAFIAVALLALGAGGAAWASPRVLPPEPPAAAGTAGPADDRGKSPSAVPPQQGRGRMLYENHCLSCHESVVHVRTRRSVRALPQLRGWVAYWAGYLNLRWGAEEVEEVANHLDASYYQLGRP